MADPRVLTAAESDLLAADVDVWLDQEDCPCEGTCQCEDSGS